MAVPPAPVGVNGHLPRVSRQSHLSVNDKGDNEMIPKAVQRSPVIYLTAEENTGKYQLGDGAFFSHGHGKTTTRRIWYDLLYGSVVPTVV